MNSPLLRPLSKGTRERLVRAAVAVVQRDPAHRVTLLQGFPPVFVDSAPRVGVPDTQVRQDLQQIESKRGLGLAGMRNHPLVVWLENGSRLGGAGWEGQAFRDGYTEVTGRRLPPPSVTIQSEAVSSPPQPPPSLAIPPSAYLGFLALCGVCFGVSWLIEYFVGQ